MPRPLQESFGTERLSSGIVPSLHPLDGPMWIDGENVVFRDRSVRKAPGFASAFTKPAAKAVRGLGQQRQLDLTQHLYFGNVDSLYKWDATNVTDVSRAAGYNGQTDETVTQAATAWSFTPFGDWMLATNGVDPVQVYKPANGQFQDLANTTFDWAQVLIGRGPYNLAINTSNGPDRVEWHDIDDPETWTPQDTNTAGFLQLREALGPLRAAARFGDRIAVYSTEQMFLINFLGDQATFGYEPVLSGIGAVGKLAVTSIGQRNMGVGRQGVWVSDGTQVEYVDEPHVRRYLQQNVNWDQASKITAWHDEENEQVVFSFPLIGGSGEPEESWAFRYQNNTWTKYAYARTAAIPRDVFAYPVAATDAGDVYFHNSGVDADGAALGARVRSKPLALGAPGHVKTIKRLRALLRDTSGTGLRMRVGAQNDLNEAIDWSSWKAVDEAADPVDFRKTGEYVRFEFESTDTGDDWALSGLMFMGEYRGRRI